jgi:hypothetical protein
VRLLVITKAIRGAGDNQAADAFREAVAVSTMAERRSTGP